MLLSVALLPAAGENLRLSWFNSLKISNFSSTCLQLMVKNEICLAGCFEALQYLWNYLFLTSDCSRYYVSAQAFVTLLSSVVCKASPPLFCCTLDPRVAWFLTAKTAGGRGCSQGEDFHLIKYSTNTEKNIRGDYSNFILWKSLLYSRGHKAMEKRIK